MSGRPTFTRAQVLAHRFAAQGLDRGTDDPRRVAAWDLGLQNTPDGAAAQSLAARLVGGAAHVPDLTDARRHVSVWATRGAPTVLHPGDARRFAAALWPVDQADAVTRLAGNGTQLKQAGVDPVEAIATTARAMSEVVTSTMTKGEVSTAVSAVLPEQYITWCRACEAHHLGDQLMRLAGLPAGLRLVVGVSPATLTPLPRWSGVPDGRLGTAALVLAYLAQLGPAGPAEVASFLGTNQRPVRSIWPEGLVEVEVEGRRAFLPEDVVVTAGAAPAPEGVRLLPRSDPWMLARDRDLIVPDRGVHRTLWPVIGHPGAVLADGEVVAAWRTKSSGSRLDVRVIPFGRLRPAVRRAVEDEAAHVATLRGAADLAVRFE